MSDREVRDELLTLLIAGHETTATALWWSFERLLRHPEALGAAAPRSSAARGRLSRCGGPRDAAPAAGPADHRPEADPPVEIGPWTFPRAGR